MQSLKPGRDRTYAVSRYNGIKNQKQNLVSYHDIDMISLYCRVNKALFVDGVISAKLLSQTLSRWCVCLFISPFHLTIHSSNSTQISESRRSKHKQHRIILRWDTVLNQDSWCGHVHILPRQLLQGKIFHSVTKNILKPLISRFYFLILADILKIVQPLPLMPQTGIWTHLASKTGAAKHPF